jgi:hypothetical protein
VHSPMSIEYKPASGLAGVLCIALRSEFRVYAAPRGRPPKGGTPNQVPPVFQRIPRDDILPFGGTIFHPPVNESSEPERKLQVKAQRSRFCSGHFNPLIRGESVTNLLGYGDRRSDRSMFEKQYRHSSRQTDATVRRREWWDIALMHRVTASEEHRVRHSRAIEMGPFRLAVFS